MVIILSSITLAVSDAELLPHLIAQYTMEDGSGTNIEDITNGNNLTITSCDVQGWVTNTVDSSGAWKSNGDDDCRAVLQSDVFHEFGAVEMWVNITNAGNSKAVWTIGNTTNDGYYAVLQHNSGKHRFDVNPPGLYPVSDTAVTLNTWKHYVMRHNVSHWTLFIDGVPDMVQATTDMFSDSGRNIFALGVKISFDGIQFENIIEYDNVRVWSKNLTSEEIVYLYNGGTPKTIGASPSGTITTTLIAPTNNTYSNNYFQDFTFNYTSAGCTESAGNDFNSTNITDSEIMDNYFFWDSGDRKYYLHFQYNLHLYN